MVIMASRTYGALPFDNEARKGSTGAARRRTFVLFPCCGRSLKALFTWDVRASDEPEDEKVGALEVYCQIKKTRDRCLQAELMVAPNSPAASVGFDPIRWRCPFRVLGNTLNSDSRDGATGAPEVQTDQLTLRMPC